MRIVVVSAALAVALLSVAAAGPAGIRATSSAYWTIRADARMCPSPACGGFFARRVNQAVSVCADGKARRECYVAALDLTPLRLPADARAGVQATLTRGGLARGRLAVGYHGFAGLGRLVVSRAWRGLGMAGQEQLYRVVDTGLRCVTAPCFYLEATPLNGGSPISLSHLVLSPPGASQAQIVKAEHLLDERSLLVAGNVAKAEAGEGRTLVATAFYLPI